MFVPFVGFRSLFRWSRGGPGPSTLSNFTRKSGLLETMARRFSSPPPPVSPAESATRRMDGGGWTRCGEGRKEGVVIEKKERFPVPRGPCSEEDQRPDKSSSSRGPPARERPALRASTRLVHCPRPSSSSSSPTTTLDLAV